MSPMALQFSADSDGLPRSDVTLGHIAVYFTRNMVAVWKKWNLDSECHLSHERCTETTFGP